MNFLIPDKEPKLTESEIMKALEELEEVCEQECPHEEGGRECMQYKCLYIPPKPILALITDKNDSIEMYRRNIALLDEQILAKDKEIERLQKAIKVQEIMLGNQDYAIKKAKAEAIKEVFNELEKAKTPCVAKNGFITDVVLWDELVKIAKEMGVEL